MQTILLGVSPLIGSRLAYGCWRIAGSGNPDEASPDTAAKGRRAVIAAYEAGYTVFDNADIYGRGEAERLFGATMKEVSGMREKVIVITKGGIRPGGVPSADSPGRYDFSESHLTEACEQSLKRLGIETIDIYLLHRPDYLANPEEIAETFQKLRNSGKVKHFGLSNFRPSLVTAVQATCPMPLIVHQVEISLARLDAFTDGTLDQCLIERVTPQAWSPLAAGLLGQGAHSLLPGQRGYNPAEAVALADEIGKSHGVSRSAIALAWLLMHPAKIQPVIGSIVPERIRDAVTATEVKLTREQWYRLLVAARGEPMP